MASTARNPIVAVMGHIDHGKSSLLDYIRKTNVTAGEAGGITQHVSAYVATHEYEGKTRGISFLDTPGHEAFRALRARGAAAADIAILVIAADEGVKPQTKEAYEEIMGAQIPFVVAFTKKDKNGADVEKAKISALEAGIYLEGLGGSIAYAAVSSKTGEGVPELLDLVLLTSDLNEPTGDPAAQGEGFVLESSQDAKRGISATLIVKNGTVHTGAFAVAGPAYAPIRFIEDFQGARIADAGPSLPIVISGWNALPTAGQPFITVASKKEAEKMIVAPQKPSSPVHTMQHSSKTLLPIVIKADVTGSVEAITGLVDKLTHERVALKILSSGIGAVSENDVKIAAAAQGVIVAFHTGIETNARDLAERTQVPIESFTIIYELEKRVSELMQERAPKMKSEEIVGEAKVLKFFSMSGSKQVLGAKFISGSIAVGAQVKIMRRTIELDKGKILNLQQARVDMQEIHTEGEFGLQVESKTEIAGGDTLIAYRIVET